MADLCRHGNEGSDSIKCMEFLTKGRNLLFDSGGGQNRIAFASSITLQF
jgi:hypothetical protein